MNSAEVQFGSCRVNHSIGGHCVAIQSSLDLVGNKEFVSDSAAQFAMRGVRGAEDYLAKSQFTIDQTNNDAGRNRGYV